MTYSLNENFVQNFVLNPECMWKILVHQNSFETVLVESIGQQCLPGASTELSYVRYH